MQHLATSIFGWMQKRESSHILMSTVLYLVMFHSVCNVAFIVLDLHYDLNIYSCTICL